MAYRFSERIFNPTESGVLSLEAAKLGRPLPHQPASHTSPASTPTSSSAPAATPRPVGPVLAWAGYDSAKPVMPRAAVDSLQKAETETTAASPQQQGQHGDSSNCRAEGQAAKRKELQGMLEFEAEQRQHSYLRFNIGVGLLGLAWLALMVSRWFSPPATLHAQHHPHDSLILHHPKYQNNSYSVECRLNRTNAAVTRHFKLNHLPRCGPSGAVAQPGLSLHCRLQIMRLISHNTVRAISAYGGRTVDVTQRPRLTVGHRPVNYDHLNHESVPVVDFVDDKNRMKKKKLSIATFSQSEDGPPARLILTINGNLAISEGGQSVMTVRCMILMSICPPSKWADIA
eukprot:g39503.t1